MQLLTIRKTPERQGMLQVLKPFFCEKLGKVKMHDSEVIDLLLKDAVHRKIGKLPFYLPSGALESTE